MYDTSTYDIVLEDSPKKKQKKKSKRLQNPPLNKIDKNNRVRMGYICKLVTVIL